MFPERKHFKKFFICKENKHLTRNFTKNKYFLIKENLIDIKINTIDDHIKIKSIN